MIIHTTTVPGSFTAHIHRSSPQSDNVQLVFPVEKCSFIPTVRILRSRRHSEINASFNLNLFKVQFKKAVPGLSVKKIHIESMSHV